MLELIMDSKAFGKIGRGVFFGRFIPPFILALSSASGAALLKPDHFAWSIVFLILSVALMYKCIRVIYKNADVLSLGKSLSLILNKDGATGSNIQKKSRDFKRLEVLKVTIRKDQNGILVSFYLNRQRKKFVGMVNSIAHDYYLTEESEKALRRFLTVSWGGNLKVNTDGIRESYIWKPEKS
jgi:hypothetical protein